MMLDCIEHADSVPAQAKQIADLEDQVGKERADRALRSAEAIARSRHECITEDAKLIEALIAKLDEYDVALGPETWRWSTPLGLGGSAALRAWTRHMRGSWLWSRGG